MTRSFESGFFERARFRFRFDEFIAEIVGQSCDHVILQLEEVSHVFLESVGPKMRAGFAVDELGVDAHTVSSR